MPRRRPLILVCNDDGYHARGLQALVDVAKEAGEAVVVAPERAQSGTGHAVTLQMPLRLEKVQSGNCFAGYRCSGTPADCVKIALSTVLQRKPDLCIAGINHGPNTSVNVLYSGTMSAVIEAAMEGIPAAGFSLCDLSPSADLRGAVKYARIIVRNCLLRGIPSGLCLNVNIPSLPPERIRGVRVCRQAKGRWREHFEERTDPNRRTYYWLKGDFLNGDAGEDADLWAIEHGFVSVVPVQYDLTAHHAIPLLNRRKYGAQR